MSYSSLAQSATATYMLPGDPDSTGNGTPVGTPVYTDGPRGRAYDMRTDWHLILPDLPNTNGQGSFSFAATFRWSSYGVFGSTIVSRNGESAGWQLRHHFRSERIAFVGRGTSGADDPTGSIVPLDTWTQIVAIKDSFGRRLWVNGSLDISVPEPQNFSTATQNLLLGRNGFDANRRLQGSIAEVMFFDRALSLEEIQDYSTGPQANQIVTGELGRRTTNLLTGEIGYQ